MSKSTQEIIASLPGNRNTWAVVEKTLSGDIYVWGLGASEYRALQQAKTEIAVFNETSTYYMLRATDRLAYLVAKNGCVQDYTICNYYGDYYVDLYDYASVNVAHNNHVDDKHVITNFAW